MFVGFTVGNYRSFRSKQTLDMTAVKEDLPDNIITYSKCETKAESKDSNKGKSKGKGNAKTKEIKLLKSAAIYGANASGKSNLIKAVDTMCDMVLNSAESYKPTGKLPVEPFLLDDTFADKPSFFEMCFLNNGAKYMYGFTATPERIYDEWLLEQPNLSGKARTLFERVFDTETKETSWKFSNFLKGEKEKLKSMTRDNALFVSVGAQLNNEQLNDIYKWFDKKIEILNQRGRMAPLTHKMLADGHEDLHGAIVELLKKADLEIEDVKVEKINPEKIKFPSDFPDELKKAILADPPITIKTVHKISESDKTIEWPMEHESDGTIRFFNLIGPFIDMIASGKIAFIDELETSLHPLLVRELIKFVHRNTSDAYPAQLIFTTHDTTQLDPALLQRDQVWFTEKDRAMGTQLYSLVEYKGIRKKGTRRNEALQKGYLSGRYGAVPVLDAFDEADITK